MYNLNQKSLHFLLVVCAVFSINGIEAAKPAPQGTKKLGDNVSCGTPGGGWVGSCTTTSIVYSPNLCTLSAECDPGDGNGYDSSASYQWNANEPTPCLQNNEGVLQLGNC